ncbi:MAG TPA: hypothetical protein VHE55_04315, partial [Fimbriimonadaceae bacterium]|nr:hypothetical protein [Fimbriimonadaceae bacterium]
AAILDCLDPDEEISYRIVARILCTTHPDWIEKQDQPRPGLPPGPTRVCPDGPLVDRIRAHLAKARTPYEKSKVLELMVRWHIKGSIKPYMMALRQLLRDPHAYSEEEDRQYLWGLIRDIGAQAVEFDGFYQELEDDAINDLLGASNPVLAIYWMDHCGQIPNSEQMARFATLLNWDNKDVQYKVAESLANWLHEPTHAPKLYGSVGDHEIPYPDLTEAVAYWKKRFGIDEARLFAACPAVPGDIDIAGNSLPSSRGRSHPCDPVAAFSSLLSASRT